MTRLTKAEIRDIQARRAENIQLRGKATVATVPGPSQDPISLMAARCFTGNLNASDLRYMALAMLQMQDTICELKDRVRKLESFGVMKE